MVEEGAEQGRLNFEEDKKHSSPTLDGACNHGIPRRKMKPPFSQ